MVSQNTVAALGAINAALAIVAGAFGAHALREKLTAPLLRAFETGAQYHFYHALGLFALAFALTRLPDSPWVVRAFYLMLAGMLLFSGSLYALALSGKSALGAITPLGGLALIAAWTCLAIAFLATD
ncbi:MAG: DUF423 domain-containing protein [Gammaproteobacteria bacterium]